MKHTGGMQLGYCTNVHAGADLATTRANLREHAAAVKRLVSPGKPMGIGLWLSNAAAAELNDANRLSEFAAWLRDEGLLPFTLNGFPYGDFHQTVVKHRVYEPTWCEAARRDYTLALIEILDALLPEGMTGTISTLPIAWGRPALDAAQLQSASRHLRDVARRLARLEEERGRRIILSIEPEPGCVLDTAPDIIEFFQRRLFGGDDEPAVRRHLGVCHDVCHSAVMFEPQDDALRQYAEAGIAVGKVQVSAAVRLPLDRMEAKEREAAVEQLRTFSEVRYLHQTVVAAPSSGGDSPSGSSPAGAGGWFFDDLPAAFAAADDPRHRTSMLGHSWRVHFHVPIYLQQFGRLEATQNDILECLRAIDRWSDVQHFEVETYAWGVLPPELRQPSLAAGIAEELRWFESQLRMTNR